MKRIIFRILTALMVPLLLVSCYEDKSSQPNKMPPKIIINKDAAPEYAYLRQGDKIVIEPQAHMDDGSDSNLAYKWYVLHLEWGEPGSINIIGDPLSTESIFTHVVMERPNMYGDSYVIALLVTDNKTGNVEIQLWQYEVTSGFGEGLVVAYQSEGGTDLGLIVDPLFSEWQIDEDRTMTGIFSNAEGSPLDAIIKQIVYTRGKGFYAISDDDIFNIDNVDYSLKARGTDIFLADAPIRPDFLLLNGDNNRNCSIYLINDGEMYHGFNVDEEYNSGYFTVTGTGNYTISGPIAYIFNPSNNAHTMAATFYNEKRGMFQIYNQLTINSSFVPPPHALTYGERGFRAAVGDPDPDNLPGFTTKAAGVGYFKRQYHLMQEKATNKYFIFTLGRESEGILKVDELVTENINIALDYKFHPEYHVMYYWTEDKVYSVYLGQMPLTASVIYTAPPGEQITHFTVYNQTCYALQEIQSIETNNKLLLVGTFDGSEGTLHAIPTFGTAGAVTLSGTTSFGGFGKIITTVAQE